MEQETQRKVVEFSMLEEENKKLEQYLQSVEQQMMAFHALKENVNEISKHKGEILASVGPGVFIKSELKSKKVLVNVGEGIVIEKESKDAEKVIEKQVKKLEEAKEEIEKAISINFDLMIKIENDLRKLIEKNGKKDSRNN
ncbi:MAG: prefoldin subunit alpha [Nanoarchaeota archaeon]|nr:prefoldin subunit alpha [Nanoarchaeota archaeon]